MDLYQSLLRPILFSALKTDPEWLHSQSLSILSWLDSPQPDWVAHWMRSRLHHACTLTDSRLHQTLWGIPFANPIGLAAGFDKDGVASGIWATFGFGFAELGTITYHAQPGNPSPRLFRLPLDHAVLNRMGFNNRGAASMAETLERRWGSRRQASQSVSGSTEASPNVRREAGEGKGGREEIPFGLTQASQSDIRRALSRAVSRRGEQNSPTPQSPMYSSTHPPTYPSTHPLIPYPLGINLGKSKVTPLESAEEDYVNSFRLLKEWGNYFVVNVSSPNTPGLRSLQDKAQLEPILQALQQENTDRKPLLVKIAPDLEWDAIADVIALAQTYQLAGIIATNTTIRRDGLKTSVIERTGKLAMEEAGGISGAPVRARSTEVIRFIYKETQGQLPIIGVGGVFTAEDAWEKITAGASLVQAYTGWIYQGPMMVRQVLEGLLQKLDQTGLKSIQDAIGTEVANPQSCSENNC
ncbi:MAG: quinone-dependent dihydroorotate dehydrogenase [Oscillatoriales cyanobacterium C42_A2020_001]|nr:quinone-dependent dihydroorotate dehydrogenase [Leptolyngbyaceae cyanobacterium C42_A2020_001]